MLTAEKVDPPRASLTGISWKPLNDLGMSKQHSSQARSFFDGETKKLTRELQTLNM